MEIIDICREVFGGKELTISYNKIPNSHYSKVLCTLNKWHLKRKNVDVSEELFRILVALNILELDSGNFETGEKHYIFNRELSSHKKIDDDILNSIFELIKPVLREVRLNTLLT